MQIPFEVAFENMERSEAVEARIVEKMQKLARFAESIKSCRIVVAAPHRHQHHGTPFDVRIDIRVPGTELVVNREGGSKDPAHTDVYVAIRDAFAAAVRQLEDRAHRLKPH